MRSSPGVAGLLGAACLLLALSANRVIAQYAPIMPLASQSLLLDITRAGTRLVAVGERGHILYSDDGGLNWRQASVPTTQMLTCVFFIDELRGWAAGHDGLILVSDDGGAHWRIQRDGIAAQQQANKVLRAQAYQRVKLLERAAAGADSARSNELALELEEAQLDLEDADAALQEAVFTSPLLDIWFDNRQRGWAVGAFGALVTTRNGGEQWSSEPELVDNPDEFHLNAVTGDGAGRVFIAGESGGMYRSLDSGASWETLDPVYAGSWFGALYNTTSAALVVFGLRGKLYRSADFGSNWQAPGDDNDMTLAGGGSGPDGHLVVVGAVGTILHSVDGGHSFKRRSLPDRLSLSSALYQDDRLVLVGQGGIKLLADDANLE